MLSPFLDDDAAGDLLTRWSRLTELDLVRLGTRADADELRDTAVAQPLLTAAALLSARAVLGSAVPDVACGHSVGELAALAVAGVLDADDAVRLAALRGAAMADAAGRRRTGMLALLGAGLEQAEALVAAHPGLEVATVNGPGQVVLGGPVDVLDAVVAAGGVRSRRLEVAGAFHTAAMQPAVAAVQAAVGAVGARAALCPVAANADGALLTDGTELARRLPAQLTRAVRFDRCLDSLAGATHVVELAPGGVLAGLVRRRLPGAQVVAVKDAADVESARALVADARAAAVEAPDDAMRVVPAPESGVVEPLVALGDPVHRGQVVAVVSSRGETLAVAAPSDGRLADWLVSAGDPVRAAQALAVLA